MSRALLPLEMRWSAVRNQIAFARHIPSRQLAGRCLLIIRRQIETRLKPALTASAGTLRAKQPRPPFGPRPPSGWRDAEGWRFHFLGCERTCGPTIDWKLGGNSDANQLWAMNLHYFEWSEALSDESFVEAVDQWIAANPPFTPGAWRVGWNSYALSLRCVTWLQQLSARRQTLDPAWVDRTANEVARQLNYLERHLETDIGGNHLIKNIRALIWGAAAIASADAGRWQRKGVALLHLALDQILPDGQHFERSSSYQAQVLADLIAIRSAFGDEPVCARLNDVIVRAMQVVADMTHPDGGPALFGDSGLTMARAAAECLAAGASVTGRQVVPRTTFDLPDGGYAGLRCGLDLLLVDAGPLGPDALPAHTHGDIGSIEWTVAGNRIVVDQGVFEYVSGPRRQHSRSAAYHNTLAAPGADQGVFFGAFRLGARARLSRREVRFVDGGMKLVVAHDGLVGANGGTRHERSIEAGADRITIDDRLDRPLPNAAIAFLLAPDVEVAMTRGGIDLTSSRATCRIETDGEAAIEDAVRWPDMGVEQPTHRIRITLVGQQCRTVLTVLARREA